MNEYLLLLSVIESFGRRDQVLRKRVWLPALRPEPAPGCRSEGGCGWGCDRRFLPEGTSRNSFSLLSVRTECLQLLEEMKFTKGNRMLLQSGDGWVHFWEGKLFRRDFPNMATCYPPISFSRIHPQAPPVQEDDHAYVPTHSQSSLQYWTEWVDQDTLGCKENLNWLRQDKKVLFHIASSSEIGWVESVAKQCYQGSTWIPSFCSAILSVSVTGWWRQLQSSNPYILSRGRTKGLLCPCVSPWELRNLSQKTLSRCLFMPHWSELGHTTFLASYHEGKWHFHNWLNRDSW